MPDQRRASTAGVKGDPACTGDSQGDNRYQDTPNILLGLWRFEKSCQLYCHGMLWDIVCSFFCSWCQLLLSLGFFDSLRVPNEETNNIVTLNIFGKP